MARMSEPTPSAARPLDLVFLRGLVREGGHWLDFPERVAREMPGVTPIRLDIAGSGRHHLAPTPATMGEIVEGVRRDFVEARAEIRARRGGAEAPAAIFSVSLGGMITFEWMRRYPQDFTRAVIANSSLRGLSPVWKRLQPACWPVIARAAAEKKALRRERLILGMVSNNRACYDETARRWAEIHDARPISLESFGRQVAAAMRFQPPESSPPVPTLLLTGLGDRLCHPDCSLALARRFGLPLEAHPTAGHSLDLDAPEWTIERLKGWFTKS